MDDVRAPTRRLRIFLRDFRMVEATVAFAEGQPLATYFAHRKNYLNLRAVRWVGTDENASHAALRVDQVLWAASLDDDIPLTGASAAAPGLDIELQLEGGLLMRGTLLLGRQQRLSDYLESAGAFIPLLNAQLLRSGRPPREVNVEHGDVVLNQSAIQAVWAVAAPTSGTRRRR